jgi:pyridoxine 5-phosphate synthase
MTKLSVNINKIATLRNARGGNLPNVLKAALDIESYGAEGITVHPRPDERHIRYSDVFDLKAHIRTEFNVEGNPTREFMELVLKARPAQATLVPDAPDAITSNAGWNTKLHKQFLKETIAALKEQGIRTSIFVDANEEMVFHAKETGTDRIELYTECYASLYPIDPQKAIADFYKAALVAKELNLGINAGHDLNLENLRFFAQNIPNLLEVSIGHALIADALYLGLENAVQLYKRQLIVL